MKHILQKLVLIACMSMAAYMTYLQLQNYLENEDLASITYRIFNAEKKDEYPTFTFCFSSEVTWDDEKTIFDEYSENFNYTIGVTPSSYLAFLKGEKDKQHSSKVIDKFNSIKYNDVLVDIVKGGYFDLFTNLLRENILTNDRPIPHEQMDPIVMSHKFPDEFCFSKNILYEKSLKLMTDIVDLDDSLLILLEKQLVIRVYIHQKGKFLRALKTGPVALITSSEYKEGTIYQFEINHVEVFQKRESSNVPCNGSLVDEDRYILNLVMSKVGCIPTYWEKLANESSLGNTLPNCNSTRQYSDISGLRKSIMFTNTMNKMYVQPCTEMRIQVDTVKVKPLEEIFGLQFYYTQEKYTQITNKKAYTGETLLGQIGGFVGV